MSTEIRRSRCSGLDLHAIRVHPYGIMAVEKFYKTVAKVRPRFIEEVRSGKVTYSDNPSIGRRVMNDSDVFMTLQSAAKVDEFLADPEGWVYDALLSCAFRDFYYKWEKEW